MPVRVHGLPHLCERVPRHVLHLAQLDGGAPGIALEQLLGELALERDHRERVAEQIVEVPGDPQPLLRHGEPRELPAGRAQLPVRAHLPSERGHQRSDRDDRQHGDTDRGSRCAGGERDDADPGAGDERHEDGMPRTEQEPGRGGDVDEQGCERAGRTRKQETRRDQREQSKAGRPDIAAAAREPWPGRQQCDVDADERGEPGREGRPGARSRAAPPRGRPPGPARKSRPSIVPTRMRIRLKRASGSPSSPASGGRSSNASIPTARILDPVGVPAVGRARAPGHGPAGDDRPAGRPPTVPAHAERWLRPASTTAGLGMS